MATVGETFSQQDPVVRKHRTGSTRHPHRPVSADVPVLNEIATALGRDDLALQPI